ncbi:MAG: ABC transporter permease subunit [Candidatus Thorarchaeota archaeon]
METITVKKIEISQDIEREKPQKDTKFIISLLIPAIAIFAIVILVPIIIGIYLSFREGFNIDFPFGNRFTLLNYYYLTGFDNIYSRAFWQYTYQTLFFSVISLISEFVLGLIFALILNKSFKGRGIARATLLIPWAIPTVASATLFKYEILNSADQFGFLNGLITLFGGQPIDFYGILAPTLFNLPVLLPFPPYISEVPITMTMFSVIVIDVWKTTPFITLLILAALQIVPQDLYKAGDIAGASGWQKFRYITWPLVRPGVGIALIFRMMQALRVYDAIAVLNDQTVYSMTYQSFLFWQNSDYGKASAVSIMILLFILLFGLIIVIFTRRVQQGSSQSILNKIINKLKRSKEKKDEEKQSEIIESPRKDYLSRKVVAYSDQAFTDLIGKTSKVQPISRARVSWYIWKRRLKRIFFGVGVVLMCLFCAIPFLWIFLKSFRDPLKIHAQTSYELSQTLSFGAYPLILTVIFGIIIFIIFYISKKKKWKSMVIPIKRKSVAIPIKWIFVVILGIGWFFALILPYSTDFLYNLYQSITGEPWRFSFEAYSIVFQPVSGIDNYFLRAIMNSAILAGSTVVVVIIVGSLIAYAIAKFKFPFKSALSGFIFSMNSLPGLIIIIPFLQWTIALATFLPIFNVQGQLYGLILPYSAINLPLAIFILIAFFREIPEDLWKAAKVDGATNFQIFRKVILPLTIPGIFTCAILVFIASWNELLFAQVFLQSNASNHSIPIAILSFTRNPGSISAPWVSDIALMAATSLATIPLIIVVLIFQKKIVSGLTRGAVKG